MRFEPTCVALDLETTGLHPEQDAIIEVGAVKFAGGRVLDTFSCLVAPGMPLPYRIQRLTGITPDELRTADPLSAVVPRLRSFLADHTLVGHNVPFDVAFLRRVGLAQRNPLLDTYELASALLPNLTNYTLSRVSEALGVTVASAHRALADARMTHGVFVALLARLESLDDAMIEALAALPAGSSWTPSVLVRAVLRERGVVLRRPSSASVSGEATPFASLLGAQLTRSLGVDPAVLSMAIADAAPPSAQPIPDASGAMADDPTPQQGPQDDAATLPAQVGSPQTRARIGTWAEAGGAFLYEHDRTQGSLLDALMPLLRWAAQTGERVLISAADAASVERLLHGELPAAMALLRAEVGDEVTLTHAFLAEPEAYLCMHRWLGGARPGTEIDLEHADHLAHDVARGLAKLVLWAPGTPTGWRGEVTLTGTEAKAWDRVRHGAEYLDEAAGCAYVRAGYCFATRARIAAEEARVVVTTHAALAATLAGIPSLLRLPPRVVVLDAHVFEEELRRVRSVLLDRLELLTMLDGLASTSTTSGQEAQGSPRPRGSPAQSHRAGLFHTAARLLESGSKQPKERAWFTDVAQARTAIDRFFTAAAALLAEAIDASAGNRRNEEQLEHQALRLDEHTRQLANWETTTAAWHELAACLARVIARAREIAALLREVEHLGGKNGAPPAHVVDGVAAELLGGARRLDALCQVVERQLGASEPENEIAWLRVPYQQDAQAAGPGRPGSRANGHEKGRSGTHPIAAPIATPVGTPATHTDTSDATDATGAGEATRVPTLQAAPVAVGSVLGRLCQGGSGLALMSTALSVAGEFEHVRGLFGLPVDAPALATTPDYTEQTLLALPDDVPEPNAPHFQQHLETTLIALARALGGRLVAIFPSHAAVRASYVGIRRALERDDILVLAQGQDGSARQLWRTFQAEPRTVLLGAGAFWGGHEQREHPPVCVVVARLPFPVMSDPMVAARSALWDDPQAQFVVPQVALKTRQALNGLAWSHPQRNAVVLFDRRVQTRDYGQTILATLPRCSQATDSVARLTERITEWVAPDAMR